MGSLLDNADLRGAGILSRQIEDAASSQNIIRRRGWIRGLETVGTIKEVARRHLQSLYIRYDPDVHVGIRDHFNSHGRLILEVPEPFFNGPLVRMARGTLLEDGGELELVLLGDDPGKWVGRGDIHVFDWTGAVHGGSFSINVIDSYRDQGYYWDTSWLLSNGRLTLRAIEPTGNVAAVPEPAGLAVVIAGLVLMRRRR